MGLEANLRPNPLGDLLRQLKLVESQVDDSTYRAESISQKLLDLSLQRELDYLNETIPPNPEAGSGKFDAGEEMDELFASIEKSDYYFAATERRQKGIIAFPGYNIEEISSSVQFTPEGDIHLQIKADGIWGIYSLLEGVFLENSKEGESLPSVSKVSQKTEQFTGPGGEVLTITRHANQPPEVSLNT